MNKKIERKDRLVFSVLLCSFFVVLIAIFPTCSLLKETKIEDCACQMSELVRNNTSSKEYVSVLVESINEDDSPIYSPREEYLSLHGAFRESKITYAGVVNANKENFICAPEIDSQTNLSFLYANVFSNVEYNNHWKHEYYPLELMFKGDQTTGSRYSFVYISQSQADSLLNKKGLISSEKNYQDLIGTSITILINSIEYEYAISNIYYEFNYFYEGLHEVMGNFMVGFTKYPEPLKKQACYFMRNYEFQNMFYMNRINSLYPNENYIVKVNDFNLIDKTINTDQYLAFFHIKEIGFNVLGISILILDCIAFVTLLSVSIIKRINQSNLFLLCLVPASLVPYLLFKFLFILTNNVFVFSKFATLANLVFVIIIIFYICFFFIKNIRHIKKEENESTFIV